MSTTPTETATQLPTIPGGWCTRKVSVAGREFTITLPAAPDAFLDDPDVLIAHDRDGYMPYWGYLWPTSLEMAVAVLQRSWPSAINVLEIGAGIGLTGLAALSAGLNVTFSDYDAQAVALALHNAHQNGWNHAHGLILDWRAPVAERYPLILGCDVIYEKQNHEPILNLLDTMLTADGEGWIADPGRHQTDAFLDLARRRNFQYENKRMPREPFPGRPTGHTNIWILRKNRPSN